MDDRPVGGIGLRRGEIVIHQIDTSNFPRVVLYVSDLNPAGQPILGRKAQDFKVTENDVEQLPIHMENKLPSIATALLVDTSGSVKHVMPKVQSAAISYIDSLRPDDDVLLIEFADTVKVMLPFTTNKQALLNDVRAMRARGNTALYDAIFEAITSLEDKKGRKSIIVCTDGKDDNGKDHPLSRKTLEEVVAAANKINVPVFTIGLGMKVAAAALSKIAKETGGRYYYEPSTAGLERLYRDIALEQNAQYCLSYTDAVNTEDGSVRRVVVEARGKLGEKEYRAPRKRGE
jgi:Ca-activated chloride channel family protein